MSSSKPSAPKVRPGAATAAMAHIEQPAPSASNAVFGSDVVADTLRSLDIPYIAMNPGASYRGFHDSLINHLGNEKPKMLVCLHEEHAVSIAHGYAKVTEKAMAVGLHSNVGLMHATMAIFNAWCDRKPVLILGATGDLDAIKRRPWIEWIHTARDQGALIRHYTKWDDQPSSPGAARDSVLRAAWMANTAPMGPVYINLDLGLQEQQVEQPLAPVDIRRFTPPVAAGVPQSAIAEVAAMLKSAKHPVIMVGRSSRRENDWAARVELAEAVQARVITDMRQAASFPTDHPLHSGFCDNAAAQETLRGADVILLLDCLDPAGAFQFAFAGKPINAKIINISSDFRVHNGWSMDHQAHPPSDLFLGVNPDAVIADIVKAIGAPKRPAYTPRAAVPFKATGEKVTVPRVGHALREALGDRDVTLAHIGTGWSTANWHLRHPLDYLGGSAGGGLGGTPGIAIGAAMALRDLGSSRITVASTGDGDFAMGATALWTAVHYRIPLLYVICNNNSYYNDEHHQSRVAATRQRNPENKWIGMRMTDPAIDFVQLAQSQGCLGFGPVDKDADLIPVFQKAIAAVEGGAVAVVDVRTVPAE